MNIFKTKEDTRTASEATRAWLVDNQERLRDTSVPRLAAVIGEELGRAPITVRNCLLALIKSKELRRISGNPRSGSYVVKQTIAELQNGGPAPTKATNKKPTAAAKIATPAAQAPASEPVQHKPAVSAPEVVVCSKPTSDNSEGKSITITIKVEL